MQFTGKNYWEQGATPRDRALAMLAAAADANAGSANAAENGAGPVGAARVQATVEPKGPNGLTATETENLIRAMNDPNKPFDYSGVVDPVVGGIEQNMAGGSAGGLPMVYDMNNPRKPAAPAESDYKGPSLGTVLNPTGFLEGILGGVGDAVKGIVNQANAADAAANDPMSIYERLRRETPGYSYEGPSAEEMAKQQFSPLFQMLTQQAASDKTHYNTAREAAKQSYASFVNDLLAGQKANQTAYTTAGNEIGASGDAAAKSVTDNATASSKALLAELGQLGVQEGAGTLVEKNQKNLTDTLGTLAANRQTSQNVNSGLKANAYTADTANVNLGRQAGLNYQSDLYNGYLDRLDQNDQQRLQLQGQQGQAQNQYGMQIQELLQKGATSRDEGINNIFKTIMDNQNRDQQFALDQQQFGLQQDKFGLDVQKYDDSRNPTSNNAYRTLESAANQAFGNPDEAAVAAQTLMGALRQAPQATDIGTLLAQIPEEELRKPHMADLAYAFFNSVLNNKGL